MRQRRYGLRHGRRRYPASEAPQRAEHYLPAAVLGRPDALIGGGVVPAARVHGGIARRLDRHLDLPERAVHGLVSRACTRWCTGCGYRAPPVWQCASNFRNVPAGKTSPLRSPRPAPPAPSARGWLHGAPRRSAGPRHRSAPSLSAARPSPGPPGRRRSNCRCRR